MISKRSPDGGAVALHRYMAAGSCIGVETWQGPGLLGSLLEQRLIALVPPAALHLSECRIRSISGILLPTLCACVRSLHAPSRLHAASRIAALHLNPVMVSLTVQCLCSLDASFLIH